MNKTNLPYKKTISLNRKAKFNFQIEETFEAGIVLLGSEVKSIRLGKVNVNDSHAIVKNNEMILFNLHIAEYTQSNRFNHTPLRPRKLLMHRREINKLAGKIKMKGYSLIPLELYFNNKNIIKLSVGLGKGKKLHDKRETIKERDWKRQKGRELKGGG